MKEIIKTITFGGGIVLYLLIITMLITSAIQAVSKGIQNHKRNYAYKHRFDKPPMAKCYCVDCQYHNNETASCSQFEGYLTADNWFCWMANPKKYPVVEKEEKC